MANVTIRSAVVRVNSVKVAEIHSAQLSISSGDEATFGADGYLGHTQGSVTAKITAKAIVPVAGMKADMIALVLTKQRSTVTYFAGGKEYELAQAAATQCDIDSETKTGMLEGSFTFEGGLPTQLG